MDIKTNPHRLKSNITQGLCIRAVQAGSPAEKAGLQVGDCLININGQEIRDTIDFLFYTSDEQLSITFQRGLDILQAQIHAHNYGLGLEFVPMRFLKCGNHCIFCFIEV